MARPIRAPAQEGAPRAYHSATCLSRRFPSRSLRTATRRQPSPSRPVGGHQPLSFVSSGGSLQSGQREAVKAPRERKKEGCDRWREGGWPCNISRMPVSHLRPRTRRAQRQQQQQQQQPSGVHCCSPVSMQGHRHDARDDARRSLRCWPLPSTPEVGVAVSRIIRAV